MLKNFVIAGLSVASFTLNAQSPPEMRMAPSEIRGSAVDGNQVGSSGLAGVHTKVLFGDPSKAGSTQFSYSFRLKPRFRRTHIEITAWRQ